ncbi:NADPH:quinone reductase-like Zn-dependent oxidoreductase [Sphingomonas endophytica]|uniref:NADPH:quinone reductase-like Zn-dependent oxidoreductase n=1 Tax=Sphingomonas endophytica TaxID=869719 RepID=A0A7X0JA13_9SPHN|nr:NADPH:quinone oxidoreductase family protein [Sphingomonas endophytica]MBB6503819.1 NADPH:quinone reductase-like Zn-dependent oxidoreductase [Sphingomonas endophytica]
MRALLSRAPGGPETLEVGELPDPVAGAGEVVVAIKACSINYPDVLVIEDRYQFQPPRPFAPGGDIAGIVAEVGAGVTQWRVGDRVMGTVLMGGLAERRAVSADALYPLPDDRGFEEGAALLLTYATSIHALVDRGRAKAGDRVLVLGAAGGVGLAAVELAKAFGAQVVGAVSSEDKAQAVRDAGADEVIVYPHAPFDKPASKALAERFKQAGGAHGFQVIYDAVGGDYAEPALRAIGWEGRYLVVGFPAGIPKLPLNLTLLKSCDVCGVFWGAFAGREPAANRAHILHLLDLWAAGRIAPRVTEVFPLEQGGAAIARLGQRSAIGKLVVRVAD